MHHTKHERSSHFTVRRMDSNSWLFARDDKSNYNQFIDDVPEDADDELNNDDASTMTNATTNSTNAIHGAAATTTKTNTAATNATTLATTLAPTSVLLVKNDMLNALDSLLAGRAAIAPLPIENENVTRSFIAASHERFANSRTERTNQAELGKTQCARNIMTFVSVCYLTVAFYFSTRTQICSEFCAKRRSVMMKRTTFASSLADIRRCRTASDSEMRPKRPTTWLTMHRATKTKTKRRTTTITTTLTATLMMMMMTMMNMMMTKKTFVKRRKRVNNAPSSLTTSSTTKTTTATRRATKKSTSRWPRANSTDCTNAKR